MRNDSRVTTRPDPPHIKPATAHPRPVKRSAEGEETARICRIPAHANPAAARPARPERTANAPAAHAPHPPRVPATPKQSTSSDTNTEPTPAISEPTARPEVTGGTVR